MHISHCFINTSMTISTIINLLLRIRGCTVNKPDLYEEQEIDNSCKEDQYTDARSNTAITGPI